MAGVNLFLLGHPVGQSRSPVMQNAALSLLGIDGCYTVLDVPPEDLEQTLGRLEADPTVLGCNVTVPHKVAAREWLAKRRRPLRPRAKVAQAVNTLFRGPDGLFHGDSTDFDGAMDAIQSEGFGNDSASMIQSLPHLDIAILGSGGSALSIATNLVHPWGGVMPASLTIFARDLAKAQTVAKAACSDRLQATAMLLDDFRTWNDGRMSLVIQTTTVGMETGDSPNASPVPSDSLHVGQIAFDLVYKPHDTPFLIDAARQGATIVHGIGMLIGQGARSMEHWCATRRLSASFDRLEVVQAMTGALGVEK